MNVGATRKLTAAAVGAACVFGVVAFVYAVGNAREQVGQRRETEAVFTPSAELPPALIEALRWHPDPVDLPRELEPATREDLGSSWLRALEQLAIVSQTGESDGLKEYWSGPALTVVETADWSTSAVEQSGHELRVLFQSADGQIIGFETASQLQRTTITPEGQRIWAGIEYFEVVMVLRDGNWRVEHIRRTGADGDWVG